MVARKRNETHRFHRSSSRQQARQERLAGCFFGSRRRRGRRLAHSRTTMELTSSLPARKRRRASAPKRRPRPLDLHAGQMDRAALARPEVVEGQPARGVPQGLAIVSGRRTIRSNGIRRRDRAGFASAGAVGAMGMIATSCYPGDRKARIRLGPQEASVLPSCRAVPGARPAVRPKIDHATEAVR